MVMTIVMIAPFLLCPYFDPGDRDMLSFEPGTVLGLGRHSGLIRYPFLLSWTITNHKYE